jgi:hypothetical protein
VTKVPPSCADCLEILGSSTSYRPQPVQACIGNDCFTFAKLVGQHNTYLKEYLPHFQADCTATIAVFNEYSNSLHFN